MYVNGSGFRAIAKVKGVHHTTVMTWVREVAEHLPDAYNPEQTPDIGECDELQTYVGSKNKIWLWTVVDHFRAGILDWALGD